MFLNTRVARVFRLMAPFSLGYFEDFRNLPYSVHPKSGNSPIFVLWFRDLTPMHQTKLGSEPPITGKLTNLPHVSSGNRLARKLTMEEPAKNLQAQPAILWDLRRSDEGHLLGDDALPGAV